MANLMKYLKTELETNLYNWNQSNDQYAIKWMGIDFDTSDKDIFISPSFIPVDTIREILSNTQGIREEVFFQINVNIRKGSGTGGLIDIVDDLKAQYSETIINNVILEVPETLNIIEDGEFMTSGIRVIAYTRGAIN